MSKRPLDAEKATLQQAEATSNQKPSIKAPDHSQNRGMATIHDDDERLLARIGYKQVGVSLNDTFKCAVDTLNRNLEESSTNGQQSHMPYQSWVF